MSWVCVGGSPSEAKRTRQGVQPGIRQFLEFALQIVVFDSTNFPILSKRIEFLHFLRNKLNYLVFKLQFNNNYLQINFFFPKVNIELHFSYYVHYFCC